MALVNKIGFGRKAGHRHALPKAYRLCVTNLPVSYDRNKCPPSPGLLHGNLGVHLRWLVPGLPVHLQPTISITQVEPHHVSCTVNSMSTSSVPHFPIPLQPTTPPAASPGLLHGDLGVNLLGARLPRAGPVHEQQVEVAAAQISDGALGRRAADRKGVSKEYSWQRLGRQVGAPAAGRGGRSPGWQWCARRTPCRRE